MKPKTAFEIHRLAIQNKHRDALAFIELDAPNYAKNVMAQIATMKFGGETSHETFLLLKEVDKAVADIGAKLEKGR